jgi:perosamine synthetase
MVIPSAKPFFSEEDIQAISEKVRSILKKGQLVLGQHTEEFEKLFGDYCGVKHAVAVSSCTAALEIVLRYFNVREKEIIVPTNTFISTCNAVIYAGGNPILADIKADTLCIDPDEVLRRMTDRTVGVIVVHVAGLPCPQIGELRQICRENGLFLIEDAAHAHGATINGQKTGSFGEAGCFSFYPTKVMTTCTGGMVTTNDDNLADYAMSIRNYGKGKDLNDIVNLGNDWLMGEINALIGTFQLKTLESNVTRRNEIARNYTNGLIDIEGIETFPTPLYTRHSYYKYPILLPSTINKQELMEKMDIEYGVNLGSVYDPPVHLQPVYKGLFKPRPNSFPVAEATLKRTICLPMYVQVTQEEIRHVLQSLKKVLPTCLQVI